jgi:hypothetical protein
MLETGRGATRAAEEARDVLRRSNELIEQTLELAAPIQRVTERGEQLAARLRGRGREGAGKDE